MAAALSSTTPRPSLMARLKVDTAHLHRRIEGVVPLMRPDLDRSAYRSHLARLHGYLGPLEDRLARFAEGFARFGIDLAARRRGRLLAGDLASLGLSATEQQALPACTSLPALGSLEEAWGCLYVIEGSTLGGQVILRSLGPRLGLSAAHGLAFLGGHGERTGAEWRAFSTAVEQFAEQGCDPAAVVRGASETFATQTAWLEEAAPSDAR